uniref:Phosphodiesterase n=1 Tax=Trichuris muris TaxID=70415 RepID=A0A5S6Q059_TRIMR
MLNSRLVSLLNSVFGDVNIENVQLCLNMWIREALPCEESAFAIVNSDSENCHVQIRGVHKLSPSISIGTVQLWRHVFREVEEVTFKNLPNKMKRYVKNIFEFGVSEPAVTSHAIYDESGTNLVGLLFIRHQSSTSEQTVDPAILAAHVKVAAKLICMTITTERTIGHVDFAATMLQLFTDAFKRANDVHQVASILCATAKKLISCEECNLHFFDRDKNEFILYSNNGSEQTQPRLPTTDAMLGEVLSTKEILNVTRPDNAAAEASLVSPSEKRTSYSKKADSLASMTILSLGARHANHFNSLAFPLVNKGETMAIIEMHNKVDTQNFTPNDTNIYLREMKDKLTMSPNLLAITAIGIEEKDALTLSMYPIQKIERFVVSFTYSVQEMSIHDTLKMGMAMFFDTGFASILRTEKKKLARFLLSVKEGYRNVPYHNWYHAFGVAHFCFVLMKKIPEIRKYYDNTECISMFVACFCHDMDHRGTTNAFQVQSSTQLAKQFSTEGSILECHHFAQAMDVLNRPESNIFSELSADDFRTAMSAIRDVIRASDLANYFRIQPELTKLTEKGIDLSDQRHRCMLRSLLMTACDLSDQVKCWRTSKAAARRVYEEFFAQGDLEKAMNREPMEVMDRNKADVIKSQLQFFDRVVLPVFKTLSTFLPRMTKAYESGCNNRLCYEIMEQVVNDYGKNFVNKSDLRMLTDVDIENKVLAILQQKKSEQLSIKRLRNRRRSPRWQKTSRM